MCLGAIGYFCAARFDISWGGKLMLGLSFPRRARTVFVCIYCIAVGFVVEPTVNADFD